MDNNHFFLNYFKKHLQNVTKKKSHTKTIINDFEKES